MSVEAFSGLLGRCDVSPTGKRWFPVWVGRYASHLSKSPTARLAVDRETVIGFLRSLRDAGVPAWQRLQAVQSIECYRDVVHCVASPPLNDIARNRGVASVAALSLPR